MICRIGSVVRRGTAVTLLQDVQPKRLVTAVRDRSQESQERSRALSADAAGNSPEPPVSVDCEQPTPVHEHVGYIHPEMGLRTRTALAKAGRTRGIETTYDEEIATTEAKLDRSSVTDSDLRARRREVAEKTADLEDYRREVKLARGRLAACREHDIETTDAQQDLRARIKELSEVETTATAARQKHEQARKRARDARECREQQFRLEDRLANLRRQARRSLVEQLSEEFAAAVEGVPGEDGADPFDSPPPVAALAVARVADLRAPVVLRGDRFESASAAADWLDSPVIKV